MYHSPITPNYRGGNMEEKKIETKLVKAVKQLGGLCLKFVSPSMDGIPDRIVLLPGRRIAFVETKTTGEKMRPLQVKRKRQFEALGFSVYCLDDEKKMEEILDEIQSL